MNQTYKMWCMIAIVMAGVVLVGMTVVSMFFHKTFSFPIQFSRCPDQWTFLPMGKCSNVDNNGHMINNGTLSTPTTIDFSDPIWNTCNKQIWARQFNIMWDGIRNYDKC